MARKSGIWYWTYAKGFYTTIEGVRTFLAKGPDDEEEKGPVYMEACRQFRDVMDLAHAEERGDTNTVAVICEKYLEWVESHRSPGTYQLRQSCLNRVVQAIGTMRAVDLDPPSVERKLETLPPPPARKGESQAHYAQNTRKMWHESLMAALNWAAGKGGIISKNPLRGLESPSAESRGLEVLVTPAQHEMALSLAKGWRRDFLVCLEATGCRPGELANAQAIHWRQEIHALVYPGAGRVRRGGHRHKTARAGKDRVIYFTGDSRAIMEGLVREHPVGYLFRSNQGSKLVGSTILSLFRYIRERLDMPHYIPTSYRHTFATRALRLGWTVDMVAGLLGNSPAIIRRHYGHLADDCQAMMRAMQRVREEMGAHGETP